MSRIKKESNDKFYTKEEVAIYLISQVKIEDYDLVIEPSAGNGSFSNNINHNNLISLDIDPQDSKIKKMDWYNFSLDKDYENILVIGNPPFGNQSKDALRFIKKSSEIGATTIAFILPKSFKKDSLQNKIPLEYHLKKEIDLKDSSYLLNNKEYKVPSIFQIWEKENKKRKKVKLKTKSELMDFVKKEDDHDFSFRRVGFYAGEIAEDTKGKSIQSHYFIKSKIELDKLKQLIKSINWKHDNTAGPRSIGKGELINKIEKLYYVNL